MTRISFKTAYLYATPDFLRGMARTLDIGSTLSVYNQSESDRVADYKAIKSDWLQVGDDVKKAMKDYEYAN